MAVRNMQKGIEAAKEIIKTTKNTKIVVRKLDLTSLEEVRKFAHQIIKAESRLDILVLNAGIAGNRQNQHFASLT